MDICNRADQESFKNELVQTLVENIENVDRLKEKLSTFTESQQYLKDEILSLWRNVRIPSPTTIETPPRLLAGEGGGVLSQGSYYLFPEHSSQNRKGVISILCIILQPALEHVVDLVNSHNSPS